MINIFDGKIVKFVKTQFFYRYFKDTDFVKVSWLPDDGGTVVNHVRSGGKYGNFVFTIYDIPPYENILHFSFHILYGGG